MRPCALVVTLVLSSGAAGADPMTGREFAGYVTGHVLTYAADGEVYGVEEYLPGNRVIWQFVGGACDRGSWTEEDGKICFRYDSTPDPQCWSFEKGQTGLIARFEGQPRADTLYETAKGYGHLHCRGLFYGS